MNKKILMSLGAALAVVASVAAMSAYEAHVINVTAHIENALYVHPKAIAFGTVFPQEYVERDFTVELSTSFQAAGRVDDVEYVIKQKPKCECIYDSQTQPTDYATYCTEGDHAPVDYATHLCPVHPDGTQAYVEMENLCQFLSKVDADPGDNNDTSHPSYYVEDASGDYCITPTRIYSNPLYYSGTGWGGWSCPAGTTAVGGGVESDEGLPLGAQGVAEPGAVIGGETYPSFPHYTYGSGETGYVLQNGGNGGGGQTVVLYVDCIASTHAADAAGRLSKIENDLLDLWKVDLKVPPVEGFVGQDWPAGCPTVPTNDVDYGCDLWIEVTGISETPK